MRAGSLPFGNASHSVACIEYDLTDEAALLFMLDQHRRSDRLNAFGRILMALALEPHWRARARERQRHGGHWEAFVKFDESRRH